VNVDKFNALVARVGELPHGALAAAKAWPQGFREKPRHMARYRVSFADGAVRVVMASDVLSAVRMARLFCAGDVVAVEAV
jgi:hypothetical protein